MTSNPYLKSMRPNRINGEIESIKSKKPSWIIGIDKTSPAKDVWIVKLKPETPPYSKGILHLMVDLSGDYPFKPPTIKFAKQVYHPNITKQGDICIPITNYDNWKPATTLMNILTSLINILAEPDMSRPVRFDVAEEYIKNKPLYMKTAADLAERVITEKTIRSGTPKANTPNKSAQKSTSKERHSKENIK